jgi:methylated-DNA-[protein]-cysteine S-methyltransferase
MNDTIRFDSMAGPLGPMLLAAAGEAVFAIDFTDSRNAPAMAANWRRDPGHPTLRAAKAQLAEYFAGARRAFDLPLAARGTSFQRRVWTAIAAVPFGSTLSYAELARRAGAPAAVRAAGAATGRNPWAIVVPCHRIVGSGGALTGYAGGLERKRALLALEASRQPLTLAA